MNYWKTRMDKRDVMRIDTAIIESIGVKKLSDTS